MVSLLPDFRVSPEGRSPDKISADAVSARAVQGDLHKGEDFPEKPAAAMQTAVFGGNEA